ncbi:MAG: caspase family protein [Chitinophagaceae bacterium]|nr:caspase family protein [Chitinophagaceae bacterium]
MIKRLFISCLIVLPVFSLHAQSLYQVSFTYPAANDSNAFTAFLVNYDDGKGLVRLKYRASPANENTLVEMEFIEEYADITSSCYQDDLVFYKLQKPKYIDGNETGSRLPDYFLFKKDPLSGLFEPYGVSSTNETCKTAAIVFNSVRYPEQKDLTAEYVLEYFKKSDRFYTNLFETRTRALTVSEKNIKLHLLVVANITDTVIGPAGRSDMNNAITFFRKISGFLGIQFVLSDTITGNNYSKEYVEKSLRALKPEPNDIVVFYYTGHGFRKPRDNRKPPYIDLRVDYKKSYMENSLSMDDIFTIIKSKAARLNLVLSDCCNALVTSTNPLADPPAAKKGFGMSWSTQNCRDLFLNATPTSILATAAEPGQLATSNKKFGGFFSYFFRSSVESHFSFFKNKVRWEDVFEETKKQTKYKADHTYCSKPYVPANICNQYPYVDIRYGRF